MENLQGGTLSLEHRYRVESRRGRHALTTRYHGLQLPFERPVWIKVYDPLADAGANPRVFDRIKRSAHWAHRIDDPTVLRSLDYGELDKGIPFVVSERISGPTLANYLKENGPLPPADAIDLADALADALTAAHELDLAHGTLDTEWIFLEEGDPSRPRLDHFRVGLTLDELRRIDGAVLTQELVRPFPPETFERDTIPPENVSDDHDPTAEFTAAGDIYALGCVLYEAVVGFHPYFDDDDSTDASQGIVQLQNEPPRPLEELGVDADFSDAVGRAIARDPSDRYDSARQFADQLRATESEPASTASSAATTSEPRDERRPTEDRVDGHEPDADASEPPRDDESAELEPGGPSSVLVTLAIGLLLASNAGWYFFYMKGRANADESHASPEPAGPVEEFRVDSEPDGAAVYAPGRQEPIGRTPVDLPAELIDSGTFKLQLKKTGFSDTTVSVRRDESRRTITVDLSKGTTR